MRQEELVISARAIVLAVTSLVTAALMAIGHLASPRVEGHPVLLSPANWRLTRYLADAETWLGILDAEHSRLLGMVPAVEPAIDNELPVPATLPRASTVYERSRALERSLSRLAQVRRAVDQTEAPPALESLHALATVTTDELLALHRAVAMVLGSPSTGAQEKARAQAQTAADHLVALKRALQAQLALLGAETTSAGPVATPTATPGPNVYLQLMGDDQASSLGR